MDEAERLGLSGDEYLVEVLSKSLDPRDRALEYVEATEELLEKARGWGRVMSGRRLKSCGARWL